MVRPFVVFVFLSALAFGSAAAQDGSQSEPALSGYITRSVSRSDFDVDGFLVVSTPKTHFMQSASTNIYGSRSGGGDVFFGERVNIYGRIDRKKHRIDATEVVFCQLEQRIFSGIAIVDRVLGLPRPGVILVRADGYPIQITPSTKIAFAAPLSVLSEVRANIWIAYHGKRSSDGVILADSVVFRPNTISDREAKVLDKTDYDPSAVPSDAKQNAVSKYVLGIIDPKKIPPYHDPVMQARIDRIGTSLIPAYQHNLPDSDLSKILFKFQLIDYPKFHDALTLPSGIILVPRQVVERLQNDSQLATVLADNIATALEKQSYRLAPAMNTLAAVGVASDVAGFFVPGVALGGLAAYPAAKSIQTDLLEQSGRVSLSLLHDAGYDIQQAPVTWWLLASKPSKTLAGNKVPPRAMNLYRTIGLVWKNYPDPIAPIPSPDVSVPPANVSLN